MKRMFNSNNSSNKRVCFSEDIKPDSSFPDDAVPLHHFHLGQDVYAAVTYFATSVQVHLRHYKRDGNNRLFPTKRVAISRKNYSKKFVPGTCVLSENNWLELQRIHKNITESAMWLAFDRMLRNFLLSEASKITPSGVVNADASEVELMLTTSLIELLCDYLGNSITDVFECYGCAQQYGNQLGHECITMDYETRSCFHY
ncbi:PC4 domain-containing protein [Trichonephila clavipes]|nr:PC4 domain-containing protein [Trichonephila clavipes]